MIVVVGGGVDVFNVVVGIEFEAAVNVRHDGLKGGLADAQVAGGGVGVGLFYGFDVHGGAAQACGGNEGGGGFEFCPCRRVEVKAFVSPAK